ncbi:MAG: DUF169 domain-containing protein [Azoarcus sp.]|jgi:uncharacterized protein (DUF169 family)|nr:DUF169 domain-containing protein [Azoarcus sp.]
MNQSADTNAIYYDWPALIGRLFQLLRLKTTPIGIKLFEKKEQLASIDRIRMARDTLTACQIIGQAARLNRTVGATLASLNPGTCGVVLGFSPRDDEWLSGKSNVGVWFETIEDSAAHQRVLPGVPYGRFEALAASPLSANRLAEPDVCLIYATPGQMILFICGLQWSGYEKLDWSVSGESACGDSWGRALSTRKPSLAIPCFPERRYGGVTDEELLMALPPAYLVKALDGMEQLSRNGFRYPIPPYGVQVDCRKGMQKPGAASFPPVRQ